MWEQCLRKLDANILVEFALPLKDYLFKQVFADRLLTVDNKGETRDTFFHRYKDEMEWKIYHATRLLTNKIVDSKEMDPLTVEAFKHRGVISIDGFDIIKIKEGEDEAIEHKMLKHNLKGLEAENAENKLKTIIDAFAAKFH